MKLGVFKSTMLVLYVAGFVFILAALLFGLPYYRAPIADRPHMELHPFLKPGGIWGHGLGIVGSSMILLLFLYSARKKHRFGLRVGRLNRWLDVHIYFGIMGPLIITLHTAMKFHGIVSISYFSMLAVMLSGIFGRYIYMQIPRDTRGAAIGLRQIHDRNEEIGRQLREKLGLPPDVIERIEAIMNINEGQTSGATVLFRSMFQDMLLPYRARRVRRYMRARRREAPQQVISLIVKLTRERSVLQRRINFLNSMTKLFHLWHVIHKPFAYVMVLIMFVHVIVTVSFGYRWIF
jgi:hypothetical protein